MQLIPNDLREIDSSWTSSKFKIKKNLFVIGLAWFLLFTAFQSMANLQSSLNSDQGIGTISLSTIYITLVISCFFIPPYMIKKLGLKLSIIISQFAYLLFIAANVYPKWYTLIPSSVILGIFAGPLWTAKCTYLTEIAGFYSSASNEPNELVVNRFFGIFFVMFQMSQIVGNLISSTILKPEKSGSNSLTSKMQANSQCGVNDCPENNLEVSIIKAQLSTVYTLCFVYIILGVLSILLISFCLNEYKKSVSKKENTNSSNLELLISTLSQLRNKYQILIIPLTLWLGFSLAFIGADFTKSFIACSKGVDYVGFSMICFGLTNVLGSYFFSQMIKYVGRIPCFVAGAFLNYAMIYEMFNWDLNSNEKEYLFYLIPGLWGLADSAWQTQVNSIYGVLFQSNQEAAFSNFRLWESVGFAVSYAYSNSFCIYKKLWLLVVYLSLGLIGYFLIELNEHKNGYYIRALKLNNNFGIKIFLISILTICFLSSLSFIRIF